MYTTHKANSKLAMSSDSVYIGTYELLYYYIVQSFKPSTRFVCVGWCNDLKILFVRFPVLEEKLFKYLHQELRGIASGPTIGALWHPHLVGDPSGKA